MSAQRTVLVTGALGQLGTDVRGVFAGRGWNVAGVDVQDIDLATATDDDVAALVARHAPRAVVHCAAYTNVDQAESEPARALALNATAVRPVARAAAKVDALLIQISTDYVFDGEKRTPYVESDLPRPIQIYGTSKLAGEHIALAGAPRCAVVRSSGLYGATPAIGKGGLNFVQTMVRLAQERGEVSVVDDEFVTPTYTVDLAVQLEKIADAGATGVCHATPQGACSWYDFAAAIFEVSGVRCQVRGTSRAAYKTIAKRPAYSVLENARLKEIGLDVMPDWRDALERYLRGA